MPLESEQTRLQSIKAFWSQPERLQTFAQHRWFGHVLAQENAQEVHVLVPASHQFRDRKVMDFETPPDGVSRVVVLKANEALHPAVRAHLDRAGWVFTSRRKGKLQLRRHHPDRENFAPEYFNPGVPAVLLPIDLTAEISGPHEYDLMGALVPCPTPRQIDRTLPVNISVFARFFSTINALSVHLGSGIQVGVHFADGEIEVLPIQPLHSLLD